MGALVVNLYSQPSDIKVYDGMIPGERVGWNRGEGIETASLVGTPVLKSEYVLIVQRYAWPLIPTDPQRGH